MSGDEHEKVVSEGEDGGKAVAGGAAGGDAVPVEMAGAVPDDGQVAEESVSSAAPAEVADDLSA